MKLTPDEIGEYTGCTHGPDGTRLYGCVECALEHARHGLHEAEARVGHYELRIYELQRHARAVSLKPDAPGGSE